MLCAAADANDSMERLCKSLVVLLVGHHLATVEQCVVVTVQGEEAGWMCITLAGFQHKHMRNFVTCSHPHYTSRNDMCSVRTCPDGQHVLS